jgi:shikimate dehydrogenase
MTDLSQGLHMQVAPSPLISGKTALIAHIGVPTFAFKAPMIYNPYFASAGIDAIVVPMGCKPPDFPVFLQHLFRLTNIAGALITMPHKVVATALVDRLSPTAKIAGACNAIRIGSDGKLEGDMFDGEGFVRGILRKGVDLSGKRALVVGSGGVGSAIAASLAAAGVSELALFDRDESVAQALGQRLKGVYHDLKVQTHHKDPNGYDLVVNATPMGMNEGDPLPIDIERLSPQTFVGEVVMKSETTAFLSAARARGCRTQIGSDMLFEQIPAYLEYFDLPSTTADRLRELAQLQY